MKKWFVLFCPLYVPETFGKADKELKYRGLEMRSKLPVELKNKGLEMRSKLPALKADSLWDICFLLITNNLYIHK
jgi:hypothetical protein